MSATIIEKIIGRHSGLAVSPGDIVDVEIDVRLARDFGGANVVKNIQENTLPVHDRQKTFFTFDCNPTGSDQKYATNQQICRVFAREHGLRIFDIDAGIGTHLAIDEGLAVPGSTVVSTDSHANILGAIGAFGQGMGDVDIAHAFAFGKVWFEVPETVKIMLKGTPGAGASAKDIALAILKITGANGLLGYAAEFYGDIVERLDLSARITIASMATEMGGIITFFAPNRRIREYCSAASGKQVDMLTADDNARYRDTMEIDITGLEPQISRPGHPEDVIPLSEAEGIKIGSAFIGSCTNGRFEDMSAAASILKNNKVAPGVVLKIVPSTDKIWQRCLDAGLIKIFKDAGALVGNAGCAGCAAGQIGQNGPGEITISSGNRNFTGKQGRGDVYLASPAVVAASALAGVISAPGSVPDAPVLFASPSRRHEDKTAAGQPNAAQQAKPTRFKGRIWIIPRDNIDTDMIYHNRYLAITDIKEMGQYTFDNLEGWQDFAKQARSGDIVVTGKNFGAGSSRQQAVDCFESLGISLIIAESFGAIYQRNAINKGFPILTAALLESGLKNEDIIDVDIQQGTVALPSGVTVAGRPFSQVQLDIFRRGGLLNSR